MPHVQAYALTWLSRLANVSGIISAGEENNLVTEVKCNVGLMETDVLPAEKLPLSAETGWQRYLRSFSVRTPVHSSSTRASKSENHSQNRLMLSPKTLTYGDIDCDFGFGSHEWSCSYN